MNEMVSQDVAQPSPAVAGVVYVTRILPPDEWPRLVGTEAETVWPYLPETAHVLVIERGQEIVGCWVLAPLFHVECLWIAPTCRKTTSVARRLWSDMRRLIRSDEGTTITYATTYASVGATAMQYQIDFVVQSVPVN